MSTTEIRVSGIEKDNDLSKEQREAVNEVLHQMYLAMSEVLIRPGDLHGLETLMAINVRYMEIRYGKVEIVESP